MLNNCSENDTLENIVNFRFESKLLLQYQQRKTFTNQYGETSAHIMSEIFRHSPVSFALQKNSMFTQKFGEIIRCVMDYSIAIQNIPH